MLRRDFEVTGKYTTIVVFGKTTEKFSQYRNLEHAFLVGSTFIPWWAIDSYREFSYKGKHWLNVYLKNFEVCREYYFWRNKDSVRKQILHGRRKFEFYQDWHKRNIFPIIWDDVQEVWVKMYKYQFGYAIGRFYEDGDICPSFLVDYSVVH